MPAMTCEPIGKLISGRYESNIELPMSHSFTDRVKIHFNVLGAPMKPRIGSHIGSPKIITP
jgi:hypothetical protein